jgi:hypothetical protein
VDGRAGFALEHLPVGGIDAVVPRELRKPVLEQGVLGRVGGRGRGERGEEVGELDVELGVVRIEGVGVVQRAEAL